MVFFYTGGRFAADSGVLFYTHGRIYFVIIIKKLVDLTEVDDEKKWFFID